MIGFEEFNRDDVFFRTVLVGVLSTMNRFVFWDNIFYSDNYETDVKPVTVPFYFSTTGDEQFLVDAFMNDLDYDDTGCLAESFYNIIPRGIVNMEDISIETDGLTNKSINGIYTKITRDGEIKTYSSPIIHLPISMNFNVSVYLDSQTDMLKFVEGMLRLFYKNIRFDIDYKTIRCNCTLLLPEDYSRERPIEFSFNDRKNWQVDFSMEVKTMYPIILEEEEKFMGNRIEDFPCNLRIGSSQIINNVINDGDINLT